MAREAALKQAPEFEKYVESVKSKAEALIKEIFPKRISELNTLLESPEFDLKLQYTDLLQPINIPVPDPQAILAGVNNVGGKHKIPAGTRSKSKRIRLTNGSDPAGEEAEEHRGLEQDEVSGTKVLATLAGPTKVNEKLALIFDLVKPKLRELVEYSNLLKMWVTFLIPKIEDGNNFGVSIQEDALGEIRTVEAEAATFYEQITRYHISRAKIVSKVAKYPHVMDYRRVIMELDEKEFLSMRLVVSELRNHYAALYDLISKNWEKIIVPRSSNTDNMY